jgi:hypothetical protein
MGIMQPTTNISNESVRIADARFIGIDKDGNAVATFFIPNNNGEYDGIGAFFTYTDSDVIISGFKKEEGHAHPADPGGPSWFEITTTYSIKWKKGWNFWYRSHSTETAGRTLITNILWTTDSTYGLKWRGK